MNRYSRSVLLDKLTPNTKYLICVLALGNWASPSTINPHIMRASDNDTQYHEVTEIFGDSMLPLLTDSPTSRCTEVRTLEAPITIHTGEPRSISDRSGVTSVLTRRLGLIIGCCMGFVVFVVLVSVLGYLKVKKQRTTEKRNQPIPPEYISYRHFSIQSGEANAQGSHPHFITTMGTTSLNS